MVSLNVHKKDDKEKLLPPSDFIEEGIIPTRIQNRASVLFKCYVILSMVVMWTGYTLTVRYTRSTVDASMLYSATTVVFCSEVVKLIITFAMFYRESDYDFRRFSADLSKFYINAPVELAKMSVPSIAYALQNNLDFVGLSNLDAGLYQASLVFYCDESASVCKLFEVTTQLKVVSTAIFMMLFLGRRFSKTRWISIVVLMLGVASVQFNNMSAEQQQSKKESVENYVVGISAVLATCVTAGFAGVYFEKMLKDGGDTPFWVRNMQMYSCGVVSAGIACLVEHNRITEKGFFHGYDQKVVCIVGLLSVGGVYISLVMKHLDNLHKSFASAVSIVLVVVLSLAIFPDVFIGAFFVLGTLLVVFAVLLYNSVPE